MIGLDTNVLYRLLFVDNEQQSALARDFVQAGIERKESFFLNSISLCEFVWLMRRQGLDRSEIATTLESLLTATNFEVERREETWAALGDYKSKGADFADHLMGHVNTALQCETTVTFDDGLKRSSNFKILC